MFAYLTKSTFGRNAAAALMAMSVIGASVSQSQAYERWICIENVGSSDIVKVQISHVDKDSWGGNLIRGSRIDVGDTFTVEPRNTQGYCRFDIKVTYADGEVMKLWRVNLCAATNLVINEYDYDIRYA
jgi:hypothetical protein